MQKKMFFFIQPILSLSVLNQLVCQDRRIPADYDTAENCAEMQVGGSD